MQNYLDSSLHGMQNSAMSEPSVGGTIAALRAQLGLTQEQFAAHVGVQDSTVSRWESNDTFPRRKHLRAIASVLGVTEADLFRHPGEQPSPSNGDAQPGG
jgi:transcriptional regulator with XRE-family HTH domain